MRSERDYLGLPVHSLQAMLRVISYCEHGLPCVTPDGVFGEQTLEAVMQFQRERGLPVNGRVDNGTWDAIAAAYWADLPLAAPPRPVRAFRDRTFTVGAGQCCIHMFLVQSMFLALSRVLDEVEAGPVNGQHTGSSVRNVTWLQRRSGLPETGTMDKGTWNMLTRTYDIFVSRSGDKALCPQDMQVPSGVSPLTRGFPWEPWDRGGSCL